MGYIYKVTNKHNGKVYIGQTIRTIPVRWEEHIKYSYLPRSKAYTSILHYAIRKYGADAFIVEEVECCDNDLLNERELYWIKYYDSTNGGYNISHGGHGWKKCTDEEIMHYWDEGMTVKEMTEVLPLCPDSISRRLKNLGVAPEEILYRKNKASIGHFWGKQFLPTKKIYQYDLDGNFIRGYSSTRDACEILGYKEIRVHQQRGYSCHGYQWRRYKADNIGKAIDRRVVKEKIWNARAVVQLTQDGKYIQTYKTIAEAAKSINGHHSAIIRACQGKRVKTVGCRWMYYDDAVKQGVIA